MTREQFLNSDAIRTFSGRLVDAFNPDPSQIVLEDIAHALSMQPRFAGHMPMFYSVAQHCIGCANLAKTQEDKRAALFHDASEAYLLDIPTPIKKRLPQYKEIEHKLMEVIAGKFGFQYPLSEVVKAVDQEMLFYEWERLIMQIPPTKFKAMEPLEAKCEFKRLALTL